MGISASKEIAFALDSTVAASIILEAFGLLIKSFQLVVHRRSDKK